MNKIIHSVLSLLLVFSFFISSMPQAVSAQTATQTQVSADLEKRLAKIEEKVEARRKELGIPGMSLAIVKDGEVILSKGFGYKSFEKKIPVTADTQFAIGSATKAFTALSVLMSAGRRQTFTRRKSAQISAVFQNQRRGNEREDQSQKSSDAFFGLKSHRFGLDHGKADTRRIHQSRGRSQTRRQTRREISISKRDVCRRR